MAHRGEWRAEIAAGWTLLATATYACGTGVSALVYYSFGLFVEPLQQHFGWSRGEISTALVFGSFGLVLAAPALGWCMDRVGARRVALVAIPALGLVLLLLSRFEGPRALFYSLFLLLNVAGIGTSSILYSRAVAGSFDAARGLALGLTLAGPGTAAILLPLLMTAVIGEWGWRAGFVTLALLAFSPWLPVWRWLQPSVAQAKPGLEAGLEGLTPRAAFASRTFWVLTIGFGATAVACSAVVVHLVPLLRDAGLKPGEAARIAALVGMGVILGRVGIGFLVDRLFAPRVAATIFVITAAGCALLLAAGADAAREAAFLIGFALGAEVDLLAYLTSRYFGLRHFGVIYATIYAVFWIGSACGPTLAGRLFDRYGNYDLALALVAGLFLFGAAACLALPRYARPADTGTDHV
ncbi:MAG: MFS transporter [Gammaproteobacteria bacterium]|nr:MFS transporter [Gammaproteobacteria bacterium]